MRVPAPLMLYCHIQKKKKEKEFIKAILNG